MRIYQTELGFNGQKLVTGTSGTGTISRSINAQIYGGFPDGYDETEMNEWVCTRINLPHTVQPITPSGPPKCSLFQEL